MAFKLVVSDITTMEVDAIVNPTDSMYSGGGGLDQLIHEKCGDALEKALDELLPLHLGEARATSAFSLPAKYIIHTSGPIWTGRSSLERDVLGSCYRNSIFLAHHLGCRSIAFPLVSSQGKGFPKEVALSVAVDAMKESLREFPDMEVLLVIYGKWVRRFSPAVLDALANDIIKSNDPKREYLKQTSSLEDWDSGLEESSPGRFYSGRMPNLRRSRRGGGRDGESVASIVSDLLEKPTQANLDKIHVSKPFASMLCSLMDSRGVTRTVLANAANLSPAGIHKILNGKSIPEREKIFCFAIALHLSSDKTRDLLTSAGYAVNSSSIREIVLFGLIQNGIYDRREIDELFYNLDFDSLPGSVFDDESPASSDGEAE